MLWVKEALVLKIKKLLYLKSDKSQSWRYNMY